jgi:hypothetical protein
MGWETRGNRRYLYHKRRRGRRVVSEYVGSGPLAELTAEREDAEREARRQAEHEEDEIGTEIADLCDLALLLARAHLLAEGYHQHRGNWRRRR